MKTLTWCKMANGLAVYGIGIASVSNGGPVGLFGAVLVGIGSVIFTSAVNDICSRGAK